MLKRALASASLSALLVASASARAAEPAPAKPAPAAAGRTAEAVLAAYQKAIGGEAAWRKVKTLRQRLRLDVVKFGLRGEAEILHKMPNRALVSMTIPGIGKMVVGSDGKRQWAQDPINGLRLLAGAEAEQAALEASLDSDFRLNEHFKKLSIVPAETEGHTCVELVPRGQGDPITRCYDDRTALLISERGTQVSPQGATPYRKTFRDWRAVKGLTMPHLVEMTAGPMTVELSVLTVELNVPVADAAFAMPKPAGAPAKAPPAAAGSPARAP